MTWTGQGTCKLAVIFPEERNEVSRRLFLSLMTEAGLPVDRVGFGTIHPTIKDDVEESGAQFVILSGTAAVRLYRPDLRTGQCHGRIMLLEPSKTSTDGPLAFPVFHPEAYWRNYRWRELLVKELRLLREIAQNRNSWLSYVPDSCVRCRGEVIHFDDNGVPYCERCFGTSEGAVIRVEDAIERLGATPA